MSDDDLTADSPELAPTAVGVELPSSRRERSLLPVALAVSLGVHLLPLLTMLGVTLLAAPAGSRPEPERLGDAAGTPDGVNVELIDAAEYDRRYMSFTNGAGHGRKDDVPAPIAPPDRPADEDKKPAQSSTALNVPPEPHPEAPGGFTAAEAEQLIRSAQAELQELASRASLAAKGDASPAVRAILRKLKQAMPDPHGKTGIVVVRIVMRETGEPEMVEVVHSSGHRDLDEAVLQSIRSAHLADPSAKLLPKERFLEITYDYF